MPSGEANSSVTVFCSRLFFSCVVVVWDVDHHCYAHSLTCEFFDAQKQETTVSTIDQVVQQNLQVGAFDSGYTSGTL